MVVPRVYIYDLGLFQRIQKWNVKMPSMPIFQGISYVATYWLSVLSYVIRFFCVISIDRVKIGKH